MINRKKDVSNVKELLELLAKTKKELEDTVSKILQNKEKNVKKSRYIKKDIAKILSVMKENISSKGQK